jgi:hypothetical protein
MKTNLIATSCIGKYGGTARGWRINFTGIFFSRN